MAGDDLDFDKFFNEAAKGGEPPVVDSPPVEPVAEVAPVEPAPAVEEPTPAVEPVASATPDPIDVSKLISDTVAATAAALKPAPEPPAEEVHTPDPEVEQKVAKFREDWPDHAAIMDIALTQQRDAMMAEFAKLLAPITGQLTPLLENSTAQAQQAHESAVLAAHSDAQDLLPKIEEWVKTKPAYLQPAYDKVLDAGTADEVIALVSEFKKETGTAPAVVTDPAVEAARTVAAVTSAPVAAVRQATPGVIDPNDFEGAFRAAAAEAQKTAA